MTQIVLVCGGRTYNDRRKVFEALDNVEADARAPITILEGGAAGTDALARAWAESRHRTVITVHADWTTHGKAAGPIRNADMIATWQPDCVVAFPGGAGTADMVRQARESGIPVIECR